jgi:hypothetical protein
MSKNSAMFWNVRGTKTPINSCLPRAGQSGSTGSMKTVFLCVVLSASLMTLVDTAHAKGCIKGAVVGGAAGHYAGHHGVAGAAVGCAVGHHEARKHERERERSNSAGPSRTH